MAKMKKSGDSVKKGGGAIIIVIAVLAVIVILGMGGVIAYLLLSRGGGNTQAEAPSQEESAPRRVLVTPENVDEILSQEPPAESKAERYIVTMNSTWNFPDGKSESTNSYVENSPENSFPVYFDITLNDTGETIYESPILPLGTHLDHIMMDKELENGRYNCVMTYHLVDDDQNTLSTVNVALRLIVGEVSGLGRGN